MSEQPTEADSHDHGENLAEPVPPGKSSIEKPYLDTSTTKYTVASSLGQKPSKEDVRGTFKAFTEGDTLGAPEHPESSAHTETETRLNDLRKSTENYKLESKLPNDMLDILGKDKNMQDDIMTKSQHGADSKGMLVLRQIRQKSAGNVSIIFLPLRCLSDWSTDLPSRPRSLINALPQKLSQVTAEDLPDRITDMDNRANMLEDQGGPNQAREPRSQMLHEVKSNHRDDNPYTLAALNSLACTLYDQGNFDEAESIFKYIPSKMKQILGAYHPKTSSALNNLAILLTERGKFNEVESIKEEVFEKTKQMFGVEHPRTLLAIGDLAITVEHQGKLDEARLMQERVVKKMRQVRGENHPETLLAIGNLAITVELQGKLDEARLMQEVVVKKMKQVQGETHPETLVAMSNLADTLKDLKKLDEAEQMYRSLRTRQETTFGTSHKLTVRTARKLIEISFTRHSKTVTEEIRYRKRNHKLVESLDKSHPMFSVSWGLARDLCGEISDIAVHLDDDYSGLFEELPYLLRAFTFELVESMNEDIAKFSREGRAMLRENMRATSYIRSVRHLIAEEVLKLLQTWLKEGARGNMDNTKRPDLPDGSEQMSLFERIDLLDYQHTRDNFDFAQSSSRSQLPEMPSSGLENRHDGHHELHEDDFSESRYVQLRPWLLQSKAFGNLRKRLRRALTLTGRRRTAFDDINRVILPSIDRHSFTSAFNLHVNWDFYGFVDSLELVQDQNWRQALTITGDCHTTQMTTVQEYFSQTWPLTGEHTLKFLDFVLQIGLYREAITWPLPFQTKIRLHYSEESFILELRGAAHVIIDVVEQFAWLGSACYTDKRLTGLRGVRALIVEGSPLHNDETSDTLDPRKDETPRFRQDSSENLGTDRSRPTSFNLSFRVEELPKSLRKEESGLCWTPMIDTMPVASNFPTLRRYGEQKGIEIPLVAMAEIGYVDRITLWRGHNVLKGFSTMFVPTYVDSTSIQWHFISDKGGNRLSYAEADVQVPARFNVSLPLMKELRHFVGWVSSASLVTGTSNIEYNKIGYGGRPASAGLALEKVALSASHFIGASATLAKRKRSTPATLRKTEQAYECEIDWARKIFVVLFDADPKVRRGWLVDGASALLHLCLAKLNVRPFSKSNLLNISDFVYADPADGLEAALLAVENEANLALPIFTVEDSCVEEISDDTELGAPTMRSRKTTRRYWTFKDLVRQTCDILQQARDHQISLMSLPEIELRFTDRDTFFGFRFKDIVEGENPLMPRVETLHQSGRAWVEFSRKLFAVNLIGTGFGDLITPKDSTGLCQKWKQVPKGKDYLTATMPLLERIWSKEGNPDGKTFQLASNVFWHRGAKLFETCDECKPKVPCDRVQSLLPSVALCRKRHPGSFDGYEEGAVIFGRSDMFPFWFPKKTSESPKEGTHEDPPEDDFQDSGVGTSVDSGSTT